MSMLKHITIINQYIGSPYHGMEYRHYYLAKNLIQQGYTVTLVSGSYSHLFSQPPQVKEDFTSEMIDGIEYIWVKVPTYSSSKSIGRIWNMFYFSWKLRSLKIERSHILVSSPSLFPVTVAKKWADMFRSKLLFEVRDIWPLTLMELSNLSPYHPLIKIMQYYEKFAYKQSAHVISLLPNAKEHFISQGMKPNKFVYIPNGIEVQTDKFDDLPEEIAEKIPKDKFIVAYSGTVGIANNLDYFIEAAVLLKEESSICFIILGHGGEKERLQKKASSLDLENILFLDPIKKEQVFGFLQKIDVAFISLVKEPLFRFGVSPNKVFDYMYAAKPIIWAIEAGNNLVEEASCGISVPLNSPETLKEAILSLYRLSPESREKLGKNGYNFVTRHHTYRALAEKLIETVKE